MVNLHHFPYVYGLTTRLETIKLHGNLQDPRAQSPHRRLTVYIDNLVQWESAVCSSKYSWRADSPLHFAASSSIRIELSSLSVSPAALPGSYKHLGSFSGRVIELLDSCSVDIGTGGKVHCIIQLASVHCIDTSTSETHDDSSDGVMRSLRQVAEDILATNVMEWKDARTKIVQSCHFTISVCKLLKGEAHDRRILDLAKLLCNLYKAIRSQPNTFVKAVAREGLQVASLMDRYGKLPFENRDLDSVVNKDMKDYSEVVRARCESLMKDVNAG